MGFFLKKQISKTCQIGVWQIEEDYKTLFSSLNLDEEDKNILENFKNEKRKIEWLSVRFLLKKLTGKERKILYKKSGQPFIKNSSKTISITHTKDLVGIILSKKGKVGIDVEFMSEKIGRIALRFLSQKELKDIDFSQRIKHLYLHWCAKETLFKIYEDRALEFKENLKILNFKVENEGSFEGVIDKNNIKEKYTLNYFVKNNFVIVWAIAN